MFRERQYPRYEYEAPVIIKQKSETRWEACTISDISLGGVLLKGKKLPEVGTIIQIHLVNLMDGNMIQLEGKVVRFVPEPRGPATGIEFIIPSGSPELKRLCELLDKNLDVNNGGKPLTPEEQKAVIVKATEILDRAQYLDFYETLGFDYTIRSSYLESMKNRLLNFFNISLEGFNSHDLKIIKEATALTKRVLGILANPARRLEYDIATGKISPNTIKDAVTVHNLDISAHKKFWETKYPSKVKKANELFLKYKEEKAKGNSEKANELLKEIHSLSPFATLQL